MWTFSYPLNCFHRVSGTVDIVKTLKEFCGFIAHAIFLNQRLRNSKPTERSPKQDLYNIGKDVLCSVTPMDMTASKAFSK